MPLIGGFVSSSHKGDGITDRVIRGVVVIPQTEGDTPALLLSSCSELPAVAVALGLSLLAMAPLQLSQSERLLPQLS